MRFLDQLAGWEGFASPKNLPARKSFQEFDADNSGELSTSEVQAVLEARDADSPGGRL